MSWYIVPEYCPGPFYMGWHLYLRQRLDGSRNDDGEWGWIRRGRCVAYALDAALDGHGHPALTRYPLDTPKEIREWDSLVDWFKDRFPRGVEVEPDELPYPRKLRIVRDL